MNVTCKYIVLDGIEKYRISSTKNPPILRLNFQQKRAFIVGFINSMPSRGFRKWWYPQIIHFNRVFHYFHHPFSGTPIFGNPHLSESIATLSNGSRFWFWWSQGSGERCLPDPPKWSWTNTYPRWWNEHNIAPENWWLEYDRFPFGNPYFQVLYMLVSGRVSVFFWI